MQPRPGIQRRFNVIALAVSNAALFGVACVVIIIAAVIWIVRR